ncbi:alpha/beta fold hydrolase [Archangium lansingense]|uniref:Alpha/beta hydrolase n=1 Tax=Archangium lansingense TaxID=2995310 RepID=A0ABT4A221_9BACT|nr:alpha/beta hydrolase [Archangium lansinium]MCY1075641.1 alpha/beta hydrolase [Archangium lansinium]
MRTLDLDGPVHYKDFGGSGPTMVLVHGLGGSHHNWMMVGEKLARRARVLALDLVGFGLTPPEGRSASIHANQALLDRFIQAVSPHEPVLLMGNSMGGAISVLQAARQPQRVSGLVLVNPAQPRADDTGMEAGVFLQFAAYSIPGLGEFFVKRRAARFGPEKLTLGMLKLCCRDLSRFPEGVVQAHVDFARERHERMPWSNETFVEAARSLVMQLLRKKQFREMEKRIRVPTLLVQGSEDRLVPVANSRELARVRPDWTYVEYPGVGHTPMMEIPEEFISTVETWLDGPGRAALGAEERVARAS